MNAFDCRLFVEDLRKEEEEEEGGWASTCEMGWHTVLVYGRGHNVPYVT